MVYSKVIKHEKQDTPLGVSLFLKTWYTSHMLYISKAVILYFHLVLTKGTRRYADLYNHEKDQSPLLYMKKRLGNL